MADDTNPMVQQRRLRSELRRLRESASLVQKQVADALEWSPSKVIRIETGAVGITKTDLIALLHLYGVQDQARIDDMTELARNSRQRAWWDEYRDLYRPVFITSLGLEDSASIVRQYQGLAIPGLLQTREYAKALITAFGTPSELIDVGVEVRLRRQQLLDQKNHLELFYILDEAVIRRPVGGPEVMRKQLERLKQLNRRPNISIQIARFDLGAYPGLKGSFTIFELPHQDEDLTVQLDFADQDVLIQNNPGEASRFVETFFELEALASPKTDTEKFIDEILGTMSGGQPAKRKGASGASADS